VKPLSKVSGIALEWVMSLDVMIAKGEVVGRCADGLRVNYPIIGGTFECRGAQGQVLPGGADAYRLRPDGIGELDARYSLMCDDGRIINVHNLGLLRLTEAGKAMEARDIWPIPEHEYLCTCTPRFQVAEGELGWLTQQVFTGRVHYPTADRVLIRCFALTPQP